MQKKSCLPTVLNVKAFTLIELLVVVLIIGILASVALPQYKKAVYKSRYAKLELLANEYVNAAEAYRLAAGEWPKDFDVLAISPTGTVANPNGDDCRQTNGMFCCMVASIADYQNASVACGMLDNTLFYMVRLSDSFHTCSAKIGDSAANSVCASRGAFLGTGSGYNVVTPTGHRTVNTYSITK